MLFILLVKASSESEKGRLPSPELMAAMDAFNQDLVEAGVRVMAKGLHPSANAMRIYFDDKSEISKIEEGPFENPREIIAGFILIDVKSMDEAIGWAKKMPDPQGLGQGQVELRQLY